MTTTGPSNFGPLTTIFTPPAWCSQEQWVAHNTNKGGTLLRWGATCDAGSIGFASECYPSGWTGSNESALSYKGFSPGWGCPMGFTGAASASRIQQSNHFVLSEYITDLGDHDVATACCPRNYDYNGHYCVSHTLSFASPRTFLSKSDDQCFSSTSYKYFQSIGTSGPTGQATFQAYPVIIVQDSRSSTSIAPQPTNNSDSSESSGLSTGAKIAIGVCIPVGIIIIAAVCFIWWHRRRSRAKRAAAVTDSATNSLQPLDPYSGKPELDAGTAVNPQTKQELHAEDMPSQGGVKVAPAELPTLRSNVPSEMPIHKSPDTPQAELPGDFGEFGAKDHQENELSGEGLEHTGSNGRGELDSGNEHDQRSMPRK